MNVNPLGKYANIVAVVAAIAILVTWLALSALKSIGVGVGPSSDLNLFAVLAVGVMIGNGGMVTQAQTFAAEKLNGTKAALDAVHKRLDRANIPPAEDGQ